MPDNYQLDYSAGGNIPPRQPLSRGQKIAAGILAVFAVAVIGLWFVQFKKSIVSPLMPSTGTEQELAQSEESDEALKNKDTDRDGLSDWDELNLYKTSPYLEDSDSDGFSDKEEIANGKDPNCPAGRECFGASPLENEASPVAGSPTSTSSLENLLFNQLNLENTGGSEKQALQDVLSGQSNAAALRQMLIEAGMDKTMLDQISDEDLLRSYEEVLKQ